MSTRLDAILAKLARPTVETRAKRIARVAAAVAIAAAAGHFGGLYVVGAAAGAAVLALGLPAYAQRRAAR
jgi:fatty acid desaturase